MPWGYESNALDNDLAKGMMCPRAATLHSMYARHNLANGNGNSVVYTLRVNGINTALSVTLATGAVGSASDLVDEISVNAGDFIEIIRTNALSIGNGNIEAFVSLEIH
jgi:hypothetical protein